MTRRGGGLPRKHHSGDRTFWRRRGVRQGEEGQGGAGAGVGEVACHVALPHVEGYLCNKVLFITQGAVSKHCHTFPLLRHFPLHRTQIHGPWAINCIAYLELQIILGGGVGKGVKPPELPFLGISSKRSIFGEKSLCHRRCLCNCKTNISRSTVVASAALQHEDSTRFYNTEYSNCSSSRSVLTLPVEVSPPHYQLWLRTCVLRIDPLARPHTPLS